MTRIECSHDCMIDNFPTALSWYKFDNGFLKYMNQILFSPASSWRIRVIEEHQSTPMDGHQGVVKTYHKLKKGFF